MARLEKFGADIWLASGPEVTAALGFHYPTRMAVIRLTGGELFVWSPVALDTSLRRELDALGTVRFLVAPNSLHHVFVSDWKSAYPHARIFAAPGLAPKRPDLALQDELSDAAPDFWKDEIDQVIVSGNRITTEVVFFHRSSRTVLFTDLVQQFPEGWFAGWRAFVARWDLMVTARPTVPRKFRVAFSSRDKARRAIAQILGWPIEALVMAHGTPVREGGHEAVEFAFDWLRRRS